MADRQRRHPSKEIEAAIRYAEDHGWTRALHSGGHAWGKIRCPYNDQECRYGTFCSKSVWSTPRVPEDMADAIRRVVDGCIRRKQDEAASQDGHAANDRDDAARQPKKGRVR